MQIKIFSSAFIPEYKHQGDSGMDICSTQTCGLMPGELVKLPTGLSVAIPMGFEGQVRPRSGMTSKGLIAQFGTIDSGYRGEISIVILNVSKTYKTINYGDRIAQLVICPVVHVDVEMVSNIDELGQTSRNSNGFGSTGVR